MTKEFLDEIENINNEIEGLRKRLAKLEKGKDDIVTDSVKGSSKYYPYTEHSYKIEGVKIPKHKGLRNKYKKLIKSKEYKLDKLKVQLEYELNYVKDSKIRDIIRHRYNDNKTWLQIMFLMKYNSESNAKMKLERFLKNN